jgi:DNA-binding NarL/FixJ family response regulator
VLLADDHPAVVDSLAFFLRDDVEIVAAVRDGQALLDAAQRLQPEHVMAVRAELGASAARTDTMVPQCRGIRRPTFG